MEIVEFVITWVVGSVLGCLVGIGLSHIMGWLD